MNVKATSTHTLCDFHHLLSRYPSETKFKLFLVLGSQMRLVLNTGNPKTNKSLKFWHWLGKITARQKFVLQQSHNESMLPN